MLLISGDVSEYCDADIPTRPIDPDAPEYMAWKDACDDALRLGSGWTQEQQHAYEAMQAHRAEE